MAKAVKKIAAPAPPIEFFPEIDQGSDEWIQIRLGIPTSSCFSMVCAEGKNGDASKTRSEYMAKLAGEILTGQPGEGKIQTSAMSRGLDMEQDAREHYQRTNLVALERVGFVRRRLQSGRFVGCSPDALTGQRKALEIKTLAPHRMIAQLARGAGMPSEHRCQVYGTMWVADLDEIDLLLFYRGFPVAPKFTIERNDKTIKEISDAVETFDWELSELVKRIRAMGRG